MLFELQNVRKKAGYTQKSAAEALEVPLGTYRNWEQLVCMPQDNEMIVKIAKLFEVPIDALFGYDLVVPGDMNDGETDPISETHEYLLRLFDSMSSIGQAFLMEQAEYFAEKYPKNNQLSRSETATA